MTDHSHFGGHLRSFIPQIFFLSRRREILIATTIFAAIVTSSCERLIPTDSASVDFKKEKGNTVSGGADNGYREAEVISDADGAVTGRILDSTTGHQLKASSSSSIKGSSAKFPIGSLAIGTEVTMEPGADLATTGTAAELGINEIAMTKASEPVVVTTTSKPSAPFTLSIPLPEASLTLASEDAYEFLVIIFKIKLPGTDKYLSGIIPRSFLAVKKGFVEFETENNGSFQAVYTSIRVVEARQSAPSSIPFVTIRSELALPPIAWTVTQTTDQLTRAVTFKFSASGIGEVDQCMAISDRDKKSPWDSQKNLGKSGVYSVNPMNDDAHTLYLAFSCRGSTGRETGQSSWQEAVFVAKAVPSPSPSPTASPSPSPTVAPGNTSPSLDTITDRSVSENSPMPTVDAGEGGFDHDADGDAITYSCHFDSVIDSTVGVANLCSTLTGVSFNTTSGVLNWTPDYSQSGSYEFKISGSDGTASDSEIFAVTVVNVNRAPVVDSITGITVNENQALSADGNDLSDDLDADGDTLTYSCYYDTVIDGLVSSAPLCTSISGVTFSSSTGSLSWTPDYSQSGSYEIKIKAFDGTLFGSAIFTVVVNNIDRAPVLDSISGQSVAEGAPIAAINAGDGSDDTDIDGDAITYTCAFDNVVDSDVSAGANCGTLAGASFTAATGVLNWTPNFSSSGDFEFKITGTAGALSDSKVFVVTVANTNQQPEIDTITDITVDENVAISTVNASDAADDFDIDGDSITWTCHFDTVVNNSVSPAASCTALTGVAFNATTGLLNWQPNYTQSGSYEFLITGSDGALSDTEIFSITVENAIAAPTGVTATAGELQNTISWSNVSGATSYTIYWSTSAGAGLGGTAIHGVTSPFTHTGLTGGVNHYYVVTAFENSTQSVASVQASAKPTMPIVSMASPHALGDPHQRRTIFDTINNIHWAFFYDGTNIMASYSTDEIGWSTFSFVTAASGKFHVAYQSISGTPYVVLAFDQNGEDAAVMRGQLSGSSISWDAPVTAMNGNSPTDSYLRPTCAFDDAGYLWVAATYFNGHASVIKVARSSNAANAPLNTWQSTTTLGTKTVTGPRDLVLMARSSGDMYLLANDAGSVVGFQYAGSIWSDALPTSDYSWFQIAGSSNIDAYVRAVAVIGSDLYIGGDFKDAGGHAAADYIARWDGQRWNPLAGGTGGPVNALAVYGPDLVVGGSFVNANGNTSADNVAIWTGSSWKALGTGVVNSVYALHVDGTKLYVGGAFSQAGGVSNTMRIAQWNGSAWSAMGTGVSGGSFGVRAITSISGVVYAGGDFTSASGVGSTSYLASWNGVAWSAVPGGAVGGQIYALASYGSQLFAGGDFTGIGAVGQTAYLARYDGNSWAPVVSGASSIFNGIVLSMAVVGGDLHVGGAFTSIGGNTGLSRAAKLVSGTWFPAAASNPNNSVMAIADWNGKPCYAGFFSNLGTDSGDYIACNNLGTWESFGFGRSETITKAVFIGSDLYVGGLFHDLGGNPNADYIARWTGNGWQALGAAPLNNPVYALAASGPNLLVGGSFTAAGGISGADRIAQWDGFNWSSVGGGITSAGSYVYAILPVGPDTYVAGNFTEAGGVTVVDKIAKWNGSSWYSLGNGSTSGSIYALEHDGTYLYAGGTFLDLAGDVNNDKIARFDGVTWSPLGTGIPTDAGSWGVQALAKNGGLIFAGGSFLDAGGIVAADYIAVWNGTNWAAVGTGLSSWVYGLTAAGGSIYAVGAFNTSGSTQLDKVAKWDGTIWQMVGSGVNGLPKSIAVNGQDMAVVGSNSNAHIYGKTIAKSASAIAGVASGPGTIHLLSQSNSTISHRIWNGSSWQTSVNISTAGSFPQLSYSPDAEKIFATYISAYAVKYKTYTMGSWGTENAVLSSTVIQNFNCEAVVSTNKLKCLWNTGGIGLPYVLRAKFITP